MTFLPSYNTSSKNIYKFLLFLQEFFTFLLNYIWRCKYGNDKKIYRGTGIEKKNIIRKVKIRRR